MPLTIYAAQPHSVTFSTTGAGSISATRHAITRARTQVEDAGHAMILDHRLDEPDVDALFTRMNEAHGVRDEKLRDRAAEVRGW